MNITMNVNQSLFSSIDKLNETFYRVCYVAPPSIVSDGLWGFPPIDHNKPMKSSLPLFELQMLVIFSITQIFDFFLKHLDFPQFIPQVIAGLLLGPSIELEALDRFKKFVFPYGTHDTLATVTSFGYVLFIFTAGVQMDLSMVTRTGHKAWTIAIISLATPMLFTLPVINVIYPLLISTNLGGHTLELPVIVLSQTVISFAVVAILLKELKIINSELGRLALSSVLVSDIVGTILLCVINIMSSQGYGMEVKSLLLVALFALIIFVLLVCRPLMYWVVKHTREGRPVDEGYIYIIIIMVFALGWVSAKIELDFMIGAFFLGLAVPEGPPLGSALVKKAQFFGQYIFLPVYVTCLVMKVDFSVDFSLASFGFIVSFIIVTHIVKMIACVVPALMCKIPLKDALAFALILNVKGVVDINAFSNIYDDSGVSDQTYAVMILSVVIIACIVKWAVKFLYDPSRKYAGYQKRNIISLKPDSELRILACIHKLYNISAVTDVLDICSPTTQHPIIVDVMHLIELVGRTCPILISHRLQKSFSLGSHKSYSDDVILAFDHFEHDNHGAATAHIYTAISPPTMMHDDVCQLALDKVASLIIVPFHQRWSIDGGTESDDKNIRSLNCKLLEVAPCSIGILVGRSPLQDNSSIRLAMIYLGGKDDREALCLAKRALRNPRINLVVYHLDSEEYVTNLEYLLDSEALGEIKKSHNGMQNLSYQKIKVNGGPDTSAFLRDIANEHDFFIVGRRHEDAPQVAGFTNWSEFEELGVIGDLLASSDLESRAGVLVVQQQDQGT